MNATLVQRRLVKNVLLAARVSSVEVPLEKTKLPGTGWIPGETQYITGPLLNSGATALHNETADGPTKSAGCLARIAFAQRRASPRENGSCGSPSSERAR